MTTNNQPQKTDICNETDVVILVRAFYTKVRQDDLLAAVFNPVIKDNWEHHLERMTDFWSTLLLYTRKFTDDPLAKHQPLWLQKEHFDRWLHLFNETIDELFEGRIAANAKSRANSIARIMKAVKNIPQ